MNYKVINHISEIDEARHILWKVYVGTKNNIIIPNNIDQRVIISNYKHILIDRFDDDAIWIGAYYKDKLIGCSRILYKYPLESLKRNNSVEINRIAILTEYIDKYTIYNFILSILKIASVFSVNYIINSPYSDLDKLFNMIGSYKIKEGIYTGIILEGIENLSLIIEIKSKM